MTTQTTEDPGLDGRKAGLVAHQVIATLAQGGRWDAPTILATVGTHPVVREMGSYQLAGKQRLATIAGVYRQFFLPDPHGRLEAVEHGVPGARLDLLWHDPRNGQRWADEIKTGYLYHLLNDGALADQLRRQCEGGDAAIAGFVGVRLCMLAAPIRSFVQDIAEERHDIALDLGRRI